MVKHTSTIRRPQSRNCLSVFDHFVGLALKVLITIPETLPRWPEKIWTRGFSLHRTKHKMGWDLEWSIWEHPFTTREKSSEKLLYLYHLKRMQMLRNVSVFRKFYALTKCMIYLMTSCWPVNSRISIWYSMFLL